MLVTLLFVSVLVFLVVRVLPGDPALVMLGLEASPDTVARQIQDYADVGVTGMMLWLTWGSNDPERVQRSMRLFVDEVMPRFAPPCTSSSSLSTSF